MLDIISLVNFFKAINKRFEKQGKNRSHSTPTQYKGTTDWVVKSPTPVMRICEIDTAKLSLPVTHSTLSGTDRTV